MGNMLGIYFFLQIMFALLLLMASSAALYMGVYQGIFRGIFQANRKSLALGPKFLAEVLCVGVSALCWFFMYSWTYLSW